MLIPFPFVLLVSAPVTDAAFLVTGTAGWATASLWLPGAGVVAGLTVALFGFADLFGDARVRALGDAWQHMIANLIVVVLALVKTGRT